MGVVVVGLVIAWIVRDTSGDVATVGSEAPDFSVQLIGGPTFILSEHIERDGRPIVLNLWASWCGPCRTEIPAISAWSQANPGAYVIGVAVEDRPQDAIDLADELAPRYDLAVGDTDFRSSYPSLGLPATYFIRGDGVVDSVVNGIVTEQSLDETVGDLLIPG